MYSSHVMYIFGQKNYKVDIFAFRKNVITGLITIMNSVISPDSLISFQCSWQILSKISFYSSVCLRELLTSSLGCQYLAFLDFQDWVWCLKGLVYSLSHARITYRHLIVRKCWLIPARDYWLVLRNLKIGMNLCFFGLKLVFVI